MSRFVVLEVLKHVDGRFDSAQIYHNEHEVGSAILSFLSSGMNTSGLTREDIFYTTKLFENTSYEAAKISIQQSLQKSKMGYIDLFLLHSPYGGKEKRLESWKAVEDAIEEGTVKSGGVSNFGVKHVRSTSTCISASGDANSATISFKNCLTPNLAFILS